MATKELISTQEEHDNLRMFFTYVILYSNDMVCFCNNRLKSFVGFMDKEDKKRHNAISKRVSNYKDALKKILGEKEIFLSYYYEHLDNYVDSFLDELLDEIKCVVNREYDSEQKELLIMVAYGCIVANITVDIEKSVFKEMNEQKCNPYALVSYNFKPVQKIFLDWLKWFSVKLRRPIEIDNERLYELSQKIQEHICNVDIFCDAYKYAHYNELEYQNELQHQT